MGFKVLLGLGVPCWRSHNTDLDLRGVTQGLGFGAVGFGSRVVIEGHAGCMKEILELTGIPRLLQ